MPDRIILQSVTFLLWAAITVGLWVGGPATVNTILGFTPDPLLLTLLAPIIGLFIGLIACLLAGLAMAHSGKKSEDAYKQAERVADLYSSVTGNEKPAAVDYDPFSEPSPTKASEIYREYGSMRVALASHVRAGDNAMTKAQQVTRYVDLGGVASDYLYQSPRQLRKLERSVVS